MRQLEVLPAAAVLVASLASAQEVTLPLDRYEDLRARSRPVQAEVVAPPAPFALEAAQVEITATGGSARVSQRLTLSIYAEDWVRVPLAAPGSLTSAQLGTLDGRVDSGKGMVLVARGRGRYSLRLESVLPLVEDETATRATRTVLVPLPEAAVVTGTIAPGPDVDEVEFAAGGLPRGAAVARRWDFVGEPGGTLAVQLRGAGRAAAQPARTPKLAAQAFTLARLGRTRTRLEARVLFELSGGAADVLHLELPAGYDVLSVVPGDVGWTQDGARLTLRPATPVEASATLDFVLSGDAQATFAAPLVVPTGASRLKLLSAVQVDADGYPEMGEPGQSRRAEPDELGFLPPETQRLGVPVFVVAEAKKPPRWSVTWSEKAEVLSVQIDRLLVNALVGADGRAAYQLWAEVRSSGATEVVLAPPPGLELVAVERDSVPVLAGSSEKGLVIPLAAGSQAQSIHVSGLLTGISVPDEGEMSLPMPSSTAPFAEVEVAVRLPDDRSYVLANGDRAGEIVGLARAAASPARTGKAAAGVSLAGLVSTGPAAPARTASYFSPPANTVLLQARWSALTGSLGPLAIRVKPAKKKEEWF